ncbi:hypothetical protein GPECTOR_3g36 [Gonium pectorale]|uniref:Uncharacterized protein n=1 Tax=Gonium pectorale TaxID=33097 RepID=A0A150GZ76_GONPE|nr:hypothetical protein GPECTOR_3g36 [Gonium pectorale]|eukprot:KXZ55217.1 hypothetical protein GPECTOR_3g36 [Gonium pectorale]
MAPIVPRPLQFVVPLTGYAVRLFNTAYHVLAGPHHTPSQLALTSIFSKHPPFEVVVFLSMLGTWRVHMGVELAALAFSSASTLLLASWYTASGALPPGAVSMRGLLLTRALVAAANLYLEYLVCRRHAARSWASTMSASVAGRGCGGSGSDCDCGASGGCKGSGRADPASAIPWAHPEDLAAGFHDRLSEALRLQGLTLREACVRRGCIELLLLLEAPGEAAGAPTPIWALDMQAVVQALGIQPPQLQPPGSGEGATAEVCWPALSAETRHGHAGRCGAAGSFSSSADLVPLVCVEEVRQVTGAPALAGGATADPPATPAMVVSVLPRVLPLPPTAMAAAVAGKEALPTVLRALVAFPATTARDAGPPPILAEALLRSGGTSLPARVLSARAVEGRGRSDAAADSCSDFASDCGSDGDPAFSGDCPRGSHYEYEVELLSPVTRSGTALLELRFRTDTSAGGSASGRLFDSALAPLLVTNDGALAAAVAAAATAWPTAFASDLDELLYDLGTWLAATAAGEDDQGDTWQALPSGNGGDGGNAGGGGATSWLSHWSPLGTHLLQFTDAAGLYAVAARIRADLRRAEKAAAAEDGTAAHSVARSWRNAANGAEYTEAFGAFQRSWAITLSRSACALDALMMLVLLLRGLRAGQPLLSTTNAVLVLGLGAGTLSTTAWLLLPPAASARLAGLEWSRLLRYAGYPASKALLLALAARGIAPPSGGATYAGGLGILLTEGVILPGTCLLSPLTALLMGCAKLPLNAATGLMVGAFTSPVRAALLAATVEAAALATTVGCHLYLKFLFARQVTYKASLLLGIAAHVESGGGCL